MSSRKKNEILGFILKQYMQPREAGESPVPLEAVAAATNMRSKSTVRRWLSGETIPSPESRALLCAFLGIHPAHLECAARISSESTRLQSIKEGDEPEDYDARWGALIADYRLLAQLEERHKRSMFEVTQEERIMLKALRQLDSNEPDAMWLAKIRALVSEPPWGHGRVFRARVLATLSKRLPPSLWDK